MEAVQNVVIVGGGLAGGKTAEALREQGYAGRIDLIAAEDHLPYERPPLSKQYLAGKTPFEEAVLHPESWYRENQVTVHRATRATTIDTAGHRVTLDDGTALPYDKLVLATGSTVRRLPLEGADASNVHYLRTVEDSDRIRDVFGEGRRLTIVGGGWIGLEVAAAAREAGNTVTILEAAELPLVGVLGADIAAVFAELHAAHGVDLRTGVRLARFVTSEGRVVAAELDGGERIETDAVVIGVGVAPAVGLAEQAGLAVDNGVLVDASLRSSDPDVYAVGDIANHDHPVLGRRVRVEHWATALNQPAAAVAALLGGDAWYTELPYFFSDQYELGCEYIGYAPPGSYDRVVVRGDLPGREFVAFWLDDADRIVAAMNVNVWDVVDEIKPLIAGRKSVDADRITDPGVPYAQL
ncbi:NAD(P)/FAD-dependent oxidoreductase [Microbacterium sp. 22242]|uniref:NAD(P)/FAD-dependent oxidoreductase n=1 Tax=Microbacterium sp. 22242 TaxID=3453896 RepID=UPI003F84DD73